MQRGNTFQRPFYITLSGVNFPEVLRNKKKGSRRSLYSFLALLITRRLADSHPDPPRNRQFAGRHIA